MFSRSEQESHQYSLSYKQDVPGEKSVIDHQKTIFDDNSSVVRFDTSNQHASAEQLLNVAKKMIKGSSSTSDDNKHQTPNDDSIITMYLSSPGELKEKITSLKTNSPVIVLQAGDDKEPSNFQQLKNDMNAKNQVDQRDGSTSAPSSSKPHSIMSGNATGVVYQCAECDYSSRNKHYYKQHVDLVHSVDRPYKVFSFSLS